MKSTSEVVCPHCQSVATMRVNRNGFWQRRLLGVIGYYPWKCGSCGISFLYRKRGIRHRSQLDVPKSNAHGQKRGEA